MEEAVKMKKVCIIVDNPLRDLDGVVLSAYKLAEYGHEVILVPLYQNYEVFSIAPDMVVVNYVRTNNIPFINACMESNIEVGVMDTEGGILQDVDKAFEWIGCCIKKLNRELHFYCVWGQSQKEALVKTGAIPEDRVFVTGSPRYDFCNRKYLSALKDISSYVGTEKMILINTNYPILRPRFQSQKKEVDNLLALHGWSEEFVNDWIEQSDFSSKHLVQTIKELAEGFVDVTFIVRPHPFEQEEFYEDFFEELSNVKVIREGPVQPWIAKASAVIQRNCSTAVETSLMGKLPLNIMWPHAPALLQPFANAMSVPVKNPEQLKKIISEVLTKGGYQIDDEVRESRKLVISSVFRSDDGMSSDIFAKTVDSFLAKGVFTPQKMSLSQIMRFFSQTDRIKGTVKVILLFLVGENVFQFVRDFVMRKKNAREKRLDFTLIRVILDKVNICNNNTYTINLARVRRNLFSWRRNLTGKSYIVSIVNDKE